MTASLTAIAVALAIGLPIFTLGEYLRERKGRRRAAFTTNPRKDIS